MSWPIPDEFYLREILDYPTPMINLKYGNLTPQEHHRLKNLVLIWRIYRTSNHISDILDSWQPISTPEPTSMSQALCLLQEQINETLQAYSPRISIDNMYTPPAPVNLYTATIKQLADAITANANYRTCQNEPCGRWFSHQRTLNGHSTNRKAKYCTRKCGKQQNQRHRRRTLSRYGDATCGYK